MASRLYQRVRYPTSRGIRHRGFNIKVTAVGMFNVPFKLLTVQTCSITSSLDVSVVTVSALQSLRHFCQKINVYIVLCETDAPFLVSQNIGQFCHVCSWLIFVQPQLDGVFSWFVPIFTRISTHPVAIIECT